jgi:hypothetical protein
VLDNDAFATPALNMAAYGDINAYQQPFADAIKDGAKPESSTSSPPVPCAVRSTWVPTSPPTTPSPTTTRPAATAFENRKSWYEAATHLPGFGDLAGTLDEYTASVTNSRRYSSVGLPVPLDSAQASIVNTDVVMHSIAERLVAMNVGGCQRVFGDLVDPDTGQLQALAVANAEAMTNAVDLYLDQFGVNINTAVDGYREYYEHSTHGK